MAYIYPFRMTSTTATVLLIDPVARDFIIPVRGDHVWVYPSMDSLMGGFMEARYVEEGESPEMKDARAYADRVLGFKYVADEYHEGENSQEAASREGSEEMGINLMPHQLKLFDVRANARTDTRAHVTNVCYYAELTPEQVESLTPGDDIQSYRRLPIADLQIEVPYQVLESQYPMAFNHFELMIAGIVAWEKAKRLEALDLEVQKLRDRVRELESAREL